MPATPAPAVTLRHPGPSQHRADELASQWVAWGSKPTEQLAEPSLPPPTATSARLEFRQAGALLAVCPTSNFDPLSRWLLSVEVVQALAHQVPVQAVEEAGGLQLTGDTELAYAVLRRLPADAMVPVLLHSEAPPALIEHITMIIRAPTDWDNVLHRVSSLAPVMGIPNSPKYIEALAADLLGVTTEAIRKRRQRSRKQQASAND